jgi:hypothetical protein
MIIGRLPTVNIRETTPLEAHSKLEQTHFLWSGSGDEVQRALYYSFYA